MKNIPKFIMSILLASRVAYAEQLFVSPDYKLAHKSISESYCKEINVEKSFCIKKSLEYIDSDDVGLPLFLKHIETHLLPYKTSYEKNDIKADTLKTIKELGDDVGGDWYTETSVELFSKTQSTYTLEVDEGGYSGGAHGFYNIGFANYRIGDGHKITLDELLVPNYDIRLNTIAEAHYKLVKGLRPSQPLTDDDWFENHFLPAQNFAITPQGLFFVYNQYEIKPYSSGITQFLLPFSKIRELINPESPLAFALKKGNRNRVLFYDREKTSLIVDTVINPNNTATIRIKAKNLSFSEHSWLSVSFPQLHASGAITSIINNGFDAAITYPKGSKVFDNKTQKNIRSLYLLVEAEKHRWEYGNTCELSLTLKLPKGEESLVVNIKTAHKSGKEMQYAPDEYSGVKGQQGFANYQIYVD